MRVCSFCTIARSVTFVMWKIFGFVIGFIRHVLNVWLMVGIHRDGRIFLEGGLKTGFCIELDICLLDLKPVVV